MPVRELKSIKVKGCSLYRCPQCGKVGGVRKYKEVQPYIKYTFGCRECHTYFGAYTGNGGKMLSEVKEEYYLICPHCKDSAWIHWAEDLRFDLTCGICNRNFNIKVPARKQMAKVSVDRSIR